MQSVSSDTVTVCIIDLDSSYANSGNLRSQIQLHVQPRERGYNLSSIIIIVRYTLDLDLS